MKIQCLPSDIISTLPQNIIEMILTCMPIRDAVRTSILSRKWKYNWVKIPKIVFDYNLLERLTIFDQLLVRDKIFYAINNVLLQHQGPILEFSFQFYGLHNCFEMDVIILILSMKPTVKKFTLIGHNYKLPPTFHSLQQLTHLDLSGCELHFPSTFNGYNMLTSLSLNHVKITDKVLLHLLLGCPLLKHFTLLGIHKKTAFREESSIVQLLKCFPVIEYLNMELYLILWSFTGRVPRELPISLDHLKHLDLSGCGLLGQHVLSFTLLLIRSSPNIEKIKIMNINTMDVMEEIMVFHVLQDYADVRLNHLTNFEIINFSNSTAELELLKFILAKSPMLKKVHLELWDVENDEENIKMLTSLLCLLPRASSVEMKPIVQCSTDEDYERFLQHMLSLS